MSKGKSISVSAATYARIKAHCDLHGLSMREFVTACVDALPAAQDSKEQR